MFIIASPGTRSAKRELIKICGEAELNKFINADFGDIFKNVSNVNNVNTLLGTIKGLPKQAIENFVNNINDNDKMKNFLNAINKQANSFGTKHSGLFYKLIHKNIYKKIKDDDNWNTNIETLKKIEKELRKFLLAKKGQDIDEGEETEEGFEKLTDNEKKDPADNNSAYRRKNNSNIIEKLESGKLSNRLKVLIAIAFWNYVIEKIKELNSASKSNPKQTKPNLEQTEPGSESKSKSKSEFEPEPKTEPKPDPKTEVIDAAEKMKRHFEKFQKKHSIIIPAEKGKAKLNGSYDAKLMRDHINEALRLNDQKVQFSEKFFSEYNLPKWRTENDGVHDFVGENTLKGIFDRCPLLSTLEFTYQEFGEEKDPNTKKVEKVKKTQSFYNYVFGKSEHDEGNKLRIELLKEHIRKNYNMFYDELIWISANQDFLKKQDKEEKESTCYFDRLKEDVFGLNNECYTELNSLVELWGTKIDQISAIKEGEKSDSISIPNKETVRAKILTQVRINWLEYLAQNLGLIAAPGDSTTTRPEIQGVVRGQCASALNVPGYGGIPQGREQMLDDKYDLVYKTNLLSSIMNVESIAQAAIGFAGTLSEDVFRKFTEQFDYEVTYKECCKILDRSAKCKLKDDKRPFDERFKSIKNEVRQDDDLEEGDKDVLIKWYEECTTKKKFSDICEIMSMCTSNMERYEKVVPELYLNSEDRFGYFTFIKYLVDEKIITLVD